MVVHRPFYVVVIITIFFGLLADLGRAGGSAAATQSSASKHHHGRQAQGNSQLPGTSGAGGWQWTGCGPSQCYREDFNLCFHSTSWECKNKPEPTTVTPPPSPRPVTRWIETENPILIRLLNVAADYKLSSMDRAQIRSKVRALLDEELDDAWEILRVESPLGQYMGDRRLQSSWGNTRRLNKTLYIPIVVTLRGREDMADMSLMFILQALRNRLNILLTYIRSLNASAFSSLQLTMDELNLADVVNVVEVGGGPTVNIQTTVPNTNTETKSSVEAPPSGTPWWVWLIVAAVLISVGICLLMCMCKAGWFLCCTECSCFKRKRDTKRDYELQKQLAIERWRQQPVQKRRDGDALSGLVAVAHYGESAGGRHEMREGRRHLDERRTRSEGGRRHRDRRRGDHGRRRHHGGRRRGDGKGRTRSDGYASRGNHESDKARGARPVAKRSLSMIEKEIALEELNMIEGGSEVETQHGEPPVVAALPVPPYLSIRSRGKDPSVENQNALVVYDDEQIRFTLEPEAPKIDDVPEPETTAVVAFNPAKEPEGDIAEIPRKKSSRHFHYDKDVIYVCSPDELPENVRKSMANRQEKPQDRQRSSRRKRRSYGDRFKESFTFGNGRRNDDHYDEYDEVQLPGTESDSESVERRKKEERKKKKKNKHRSSSHRRHERVESEPESDQDQHFSKPSLRRLSSSHLFSSIRRFKGSNEIDGSDVESIDV